MDHPEATCQAIDVIRNARRYLASDPTIDHDSEGYCEFRRVTARILIELLLASPSIGGRDTTAKP